MSRKPLDDLDGWLIGLLAKEGRMPMGDFSA
jgi:hypothetical protein